MQVARVAHPSNLRRRRAEVPNRVQPEADVTLACRTQASRLKVPFSVPRNPPEPDKHQEEPPPPPGSGEHGSRCQTDQGWHCNLEDEGELEDFKVVEDDIREPCHDDNRMEEREEGYL